MIYFRCSNCDAVIRSETAQIGAELPCPRCAHLNVCPPHTPRRHGHDDSASSHSAAPALPQSVPAAHEGRGSLTRVGVAVLLIASLGWAARNAFFQPSPAASGGPAAGNTLSDADRRQQEILETAIDRTPDPALVRLFQDINTRHFAGRLPAIAVTWEPRLADVGELAAQAFTLEGMFGQIGDRAIILLHPRLAGDKDGLRRALSHEMVHAWLHTNGDTATTHGEAFQTELRRLAQEGAFAAIPSTASEREALRVWLATESGRLDLQNGQHQRESEALAAEGRALEEGLAGLNARGSAPGDGAAAAWQERRDAYNRRVEEFRARTSRHREDLAVFNTQVDRYNLMTAYPDGLDVQPPQAADFRRP